MSKSLNNPLFRLNAFLIAIFILAGCSEKSIPISLNDPSLKTGSYTILIDNEQKHDIAPNMGGIGYLFLGASDYADLPLVLFNFPTVSSGGLTINMLNDSSASGKRSIMSGKLKLTLVDSLISSSTIELISIDNPGDTLFKEYDLNDQSFNIANYTSTKISEAEPVPVDSSYTDSVPRPSLVFDLTADFLNWVSDSTNTLTGIYLAIRSQSAETSLLKYYSRNAGLTLLEPVLSIEYEREVQDSSTTTTDTISAYFECSENLSIVVADPDKFPDFSNADIVLGNSMGKINGIMFDDFSINDIESPQSLFSSADMTLSTADSISESSFKVNLRPIIGLSADKDEPYELDNNYSLNINLTDSVTVISIKDYFQALIGAKIDTLIGVQLSSSMSNNPFSHAFLSLLNTDSLRIEYVYPE